MKYTNNEKIANEIYNNETIKNEIFPDLTIVVCEPKRSQTIYDFL